MTVRDRRVEPQPAHLPLSSPEDVGAIAVDTNIYKEYGFRVRSQPLAELGQLEEIGVRWLVPEFWQRELERHIADNLDKVAPLRRELEKAREWADPAQLQHAEDLVAMLAQESGKTIGRRLLDEHFGTGEPVMLTTDWSAGPDVLMAYFGSTDPFEPSGSKKSEFPDAFALATISAWARKNNTKVLVVTKDAGCLRACAASDVLLGSNSLPVALETVRKADQRRKAVIEELEQVLAQELRSEVSELRKGIDTFIEKLVPNLDIDLDIQFDEESGAECDHEVSDVRVERVVPIGSYASKLQLRVFTATVGGLTFVCDFRVHVEVDARFARVLKGSRSRSYLHEAPVETTGGSIDVEVIVTLQPSGALSALTLPFASIRNFELRELMTDIDFGSVVAWEPGYQE